MGKDKIYRCIESFVLPKCDENELHIENEHFFVREGSEWFLQEDSSMSDFRLENKDGYWLEVSFLTLKQHFIEREN